MRHSEKHISLSTVYDTSREFEAIGVPRHALEKVNEPLAKCLHNYFKQVKYNKSGKNGARAGGKGGMALGKSSKAIDPEKYYIAMAYMIVSESMLELDEYKRRDQNLLAMYVSLLQRIEVLSNYTE